MKVSDLMAQIPQIGAAMNGNGHGKSNGHVASGDGNASPAGEVIQPPFKTREAAATRTAASGSSPASPTDAQRGADGDHPAAREDAPGD